MYRLYCLICKDWVEITGMKADVLGVKFESETRVSCGHNILIKGVDVAADKISSLLKAKG